MGQQKSEIDRDEVRKIIKVLKANLKEFDEKEGTSFDVQQNGQITTQDLGAYPAGQALGQSTSAAYTQISSQYQQFLSSYDSLIEALEKMVGNHDEKEQKNAAAASSVSTGASNAGRRNTSEF